jgi:hypothetical protein
MNKLKTALAVFLVISASGANAVNKCTMASGSIVYQDRPCESNAIAKVITPVESVGANTSRGSFKAYTPPDPNTLPIKTEEQLKEIVQSTLKDPESARFKNITYLSQRALCGEVNSKNSYGGYVGFKSFVVDFEGVYWSGDSSSKSDVGNLYSRRTFVPKAVYWGCIK